jgi:hypothetical protein
MVEVRMVVIVKEVRWAKRVVKRNGCVREV